MAIAKRRTDGKHTHKCDNPNGCTAIWEHGNNCSKMFGGMATTEGKQFFYDAHTCSTCGYCPINPIGYHGDDVKPNLEHPVQCPVGETPRAGEIEMVNDFLLWLLEQQTRIEQQEKAELQAS